MHYLANYKINWYPRIVSNHFETMFVEGYLTKTGGTLVSE
jgi:hypothetical protein